MALQPLARLLHISRPFFWIGFIVIYVLGVIVGHGSWQLITYLGLVFATFPMGLIIFGLNDIADRDSDRINKRKGGIAGAVTSDAESKLILAGSFTGALFFMLAFVLLGHYSMAFWTLIILLFAYSYSLPPIRLKVRPFYDALANGIWIVALFMLGYSSKLQQFNLELPRIRTLTIVLLMPTALHLIFQVADYEVDKKVGDHTTAVRLGKTSTLLGVLAIFGVCLLLSWAYLIPARLFVLLCIVATVLMILHPKQRFINITAMLLILLTPVVLLSLLWLVFA